MKKSIIFMVIIILIFLGLLFAFPIMLAEKVPILKVQAEVTVTDDKPALKIIQLDREYVHPLQSPQGGPDIGFPGVSAVAIINSSKISYWSAKDYHGNGTYDLVIGFYPDAIPKEGDVVKVDVKVVDVRGNTSAKAKEVMIWE
jgi:hypothetical protein